MCKALGFFRGNEVIFRARVGLLRCTIVTKIFLFLPHQNSNMRIFHTLTTLYQAIDLDSDECKL